MSRLHYRLSGDERFPALLMLHGFMGSAADWSGVARALGNKFSCIAADLPGHGGSLGLPAESYTFEGAARAVVRLLDRLEIERTALAGYSMGGRVALYLALRHPERCAGLFLESASPGIEDDGAREQRRRTDEERASRLESGSFEEFLEGWYRQPLFASLSRHEGLIESVIGARSHNDPAELARSLRGMGTGSQPSLWKELPGLRVPALAVAGELDAKFAGLSHRMAELAPGMRAALVWFAPACESRASAAARSQTRVPDVAVGSPLAIPRRIKTIVEGAWRIFSKTVPVRIV